MTISCYGSPDPAAVSISGEYGDLDATSENGRPSIVSVSGAPVDVVVWNRATTSGNVLTIAPHCLWVRKVVTDVSYRVSSGGFSGYVEAGGVCFPSEAAARSARNSYNSSSVLAPFSLDVSTEMVVPPLSAGESMTLVLSPTDDLVSGGTPPKVGCMSAKAGLGDDAWTTGSEWAVTLFARPLQVRIWMLPDGTWRMDVSNVSDADTPTRIFSANGALGTTWGVDDYDLLPFLR